MRAWRGSILATCLIASAAFPETASGADKSGGFAVKGVGNETCQQFTAAYNEKKPGVVLFEAWLEGYLSSLNIFTSNVYDVAPWHQGPMLLFLTASFCSTNPNGRLFEAAVAIRNFLKPFQLAASSPVVEAKVGDKTVKLYKETLRQAQELLIKGGYLSDKADGAWGGKTQSAFEAFQAKIAELKQTGLPDQETLFRLFVAGPQQQSGGAAAPAATAPRSAGSAPAKAAAPPATAQKPVPDQAPPPKLDLNLGGSPPRQ